MEGMLVFLGAWVCMFAKELLPLYYDENKLHFVTDGIFRIHIPFVRTTMVTGRICYRAAVII